MRRSILAATAALALIVGAGGLAVAQDGQGQGGGQGGGQGRRGGQGQQMDPEQMRGRMMEAMKERLGASDEDWQAFGPKIERVLQAQQNARAGGMMGMAMGGRGGFGGGGGGGGGAGGGAGGGGGDGGGAAAGRGPGLQGEPTPLMAAGRDLRTVLDDQNAAADQIREKLDAFRAARKEAETELNAARGELQGLLTQRQEAMLVVVGLLE